MAAAEGDLAHALSTGLRRADAMLTLARPVEPDAPDGGAGHADVVQLSWGLTHEGRTRASGGWDARWTTLDAVDAATAAADLAAAFGPPADPRAVALALESTSDGPSAARTLLEQHGLPAAAAGIVLDEAPIPAALVHAEVLDPRSGGTSTASPRPGPGSVFRALIDGLRGR